MENEPTELAAMVRQRLDELQTNAFAIETAHGLPPDTIRNLSRGGGGKAGPTLSKLRQICDALGWDLYYGPPRDTGRVEHVMIDGSDYAHIPLHDALLAAGGGYDNASEHVIEQLAFRRDWLTRMNIVASAAVLARVKGDSMMPTIAPGDVVLIDTSKREPPLRTPNPHEVRQRAPIFALRGEDGAQVKRLLRPAPDQLMIISDNPDYLPQLGKLTERAETEIIGKVVWWGHTAKE